LPQQSALDTHDVPAGMGVAQLSVMAFNVQRGMPSASFLQQFAGSSLHQLELGAPFGSQQSFDAEHDPELGLQMMPGELHPLPLSHRPNWSVGAAFEQVTPRLSLGSPDGGDVADPQQSALV
jgi:hypothetical protein